jgi:hypothetical protein
MRKVKMTVSIDPRVASYLRSTGGISATVEQAVNEHRSRALALELEQAYREGAGEAARLDAEWREADFVSEPAAQE